ncbi:MULTISPECIES: hypothetical protein [Shinella]|uniref:Uncharacterized protein n=1 Tax=Shinella curvata TaxID=1817964 RepID=A0ABT8XKP0_9HYPH|nr:MULTISPECIES: hypothetical protein [Shinella]MCJ8056955.1 hypothetical protein [Shinella curvata]MDO6124290.1 hypothetical protein [Shinella curvata]WLR91667.1 hypothetical protein Q9316_14385 [Shinella zoogloeoides]
MTIKPMKFTVKQTLMVEGHEVGDGIYVGQKLSDTEIERSKSRNASYFLHFAPPNVADDLAVVQRFDLDVTEYVQKGQIVVT